MSLFLVTGAAGNVASRIVARLCARKLAVRALVQSGQKASFPAGVDVFEGDLKDPTRVRAALAGVSRVYLLSGGGDALALEGPLIDAAAAAGVEHVVKHSVQGAQYEAAQIPRWHRASEKRIEASKLAYTFLRPASFASNALMWAAMIKGGDAVYGPFGEVALPVIDPDDIAAVAEKVLTEGGHAGKTYELTGPASLTTAEQVAVVGRVIGKPLRYVNVPDEAAHKSMVGMGMSAAQADAMIDLVKMLRGLGRVEATTTVADLLGRPAHAFEEVIQASAAVFRG